jgi:ABC-type molybdate transport system substrate-binding protein
VLSKARVTAVPDLNVGTPKELVFAIRNAQADVGLVYRTSAVAARKQGKVEYVGIPSASTVVVPYLVVTVVHGEATDQLTHYMQTASSVPNLLAQAGLAPLPGDPQ